MIPNAVKRAGAGLLAVVMVLVIVLALVDFLWSKLSLWSQSRQALPQEVTTVSAPSLSGR